MKAYVVAYGATALVFLGLDIAWLSVMGDALYRRHLGGMLRESFEPIAAAAFYGIYIVGILVFAVRPALASGRWSAATAYGALFGFFAYATYDLTNQATLKDWPVIVTVVDLCWGTAVTAASASLGTLATRTLLKSARF